MTFRLRGFRTSWLIVAIQKLQTVIGASPKSKSAHSIDAPRAGQPAHFHNYCQNRAQTGAGHAAPAGLFPVGLGAGLRFSPKLLEVQARGEGPAGAGENDHLRFVVVS